MRVLLGRELVLTVGSRGVDWGLATALVIYMGPIETGGDVDWGLTSVLIVSRLILSWLVDMFTHLDMFSL